MPAQGRLHASRAVNEPLATFVAGSTERAELEETLRRWMKEVHEVPVVVGDREYREGKIKQQLIVRSALLVAGGIYV